MGIFRCEAAFSVQRSGGIAVNEAVSAVSAEHYVWGEVCDGWHLVRGETLSVIEERMPAGATEQRHFHTKARQFFYVLEGELTLEVEERVHRVGARQGLEILPGERHQARNEADSAAGIDVRFLVISAPPAQGDRVADPIPGLGDRGAPTHPTKLS
jgi:quercetin dioxygenase-like cupin family protein